MQMLRKQRAQRAIGEASGEDGILGRAAFTAEERPGEATTGIHTLFIFHTEWEEVDAFTHTTHGGGGEDDAVTLPEGDRTTSLLGKATGLKDEFLIPKHGFE
jgi:hypothetical protein